eukprot:TRINITY_DN69852_c0_g5_i1.p2 TRINITY_DN69852_c0_g5~~TRINITY_DN69852_c0_g5_i1.p2  ORF type:complete len:101 (+),score=22.54 TRINITY_DN69852_c0_g5_i1:431-733(+)
MAKTSNSAKVFERLNDPLSFPRNFIIVHVLNSERNPEVSPISLEISGKILQISPKCELNTRREESGSNWELWKRCFRPAEPGTRDSEIRDGENIEFCKSV